MAEWMTVPLLSHEGGHPFKRIGLAHAAIAPYGVFKSRDGADILISIQNDREWRVLAKDVLGDVALADDPRFATNVQRVDHRGRDRCAGRRGLRALRCRAADGRSSRQADIAFARVNDCALLSAHPHLRRIAVETPSGPAAMPAPAPMMRRSAPLRRGAGARRAYRDKSAQNF